MDALRKWPTDKLRLLYKALPQGDKLALSTHTNGVVQSDTMFAEWVKVGDRHTIKQWLREIPVGQRRELFGTDWIDPILDGTSDPPAPAPPRYADVMRNVFPECAITVRDVSVMPNGDRHVKLWVAAQDGKARDALGVTIRVFDVEREDGDAQEMMELL